MILVLIPILGTKISVFYTTAKFGEQNAENWSDQGARGSDVIARMSREITVSQSEFLPQEIFVPNFYTHFRSGTKTEVFYTRFWYLTIDFRSYTILRYK